MRTLITIFVALFSVNAMADLDRGFDCTMTYQQAGSFTAGVSSSHHWIGDGQNFTDDYLMVHTVSVTQITKNVGEAGPAIYWRVEVNDEDSSVAVMEVGDYKNLQFSVPVEVTEPGDEDPRTFDILNIACDSAIFAG